MTVTVTVTGTGTGTVKVVRQVPRVKCRYRRAAETQGRKGTNRAPSAACQVPISKGGRDARAQRNKSCAKCRVSSADIEERPRRKGAKEQRAVDGGSTRERRAANVTKGGTDTRAQGWSMGGAQKNEGRPIYNGRGTQRVAEGSSATSKETGRSGEELEEDGAREQRR